MMTDKAEVIKLLRPLMTTSEHVIQDYATTSLSLKAHPVSFVREKLAILNILSTNDISNGQNGSAVKVAGLVLVRQRPGTAKGVCFITIEDETGVSNLVVFQTVYEKFRKEVVNAKLLMMEGTLQREVVHVIVQQCFDLYRMLRTLSPFRYNDDSPLTVAGTDEEAPVADDSKRVPDKESVEKHIPGARNFK
jgi:error-prone DNA polymerase